MSERVENHMHRFRTEKGLTQEELAEELSITRQTVIAIEKGSYAPSVHLALKIAHFFNVGVEDIFYISNRKKYA